MKTRLWLVALLALSATTLGACGGDDEGEMPEAGAGGSGGSDDGGAGTSGGSGGGGGTGGTGGTGGGGATVQPIMCGTNTCRPPMSPLDALGGLIPGGMALPTMAYPCCLEDDACGYAMTADAPAAMCNPPAEPDERCEDFMLGFGMGGTGDAGVGLPPIMAGFGCCTPEGQCGVDAALFGGGCSENSEARTMIQSLPLIGMFLVGGIPDPKACDAPLPDGGDGDGDDDAGQ